MTLLQIAERSGTAAVGLLSRAGARDYAERLALHLLGGDQFVQHFMKSFDDTTARNRPTEPALVRAR